MTNKEYVLNKIKTTEVTNNPWKHLIIDDFMPQALYDGMKYETDIYLQQAKGKRPAGAGIRAYHDIINISQNHFPDKVKEPSLYEYYNLLSDGDIENAIKEKVNLPDYHNSALSVDLWGSYDVQTSGFVYDEVHPDHEEKIHTLVHYLADPEDDINLGTTLYSPHINGMQQNVESDYIGRAKYIPNSAILFSPCQHKKGFITNHSMLNVSEKTDFRQSIQTFWTRNKVNWLGQRGGRVELK